MVILNILHAAPHRNIGMLIMENKRDMIKRTLLQRQTWILKLPSPYTEICTANFHFFKVRRNQNLNIEQLTLMLMSQLGYVSHNRAATAKTSWSIHAVSPEHPLVEHTKTDVDKLSSY